MSNLEKEVNKGLGEKAIGNLTGVYVTYGSSKDRVGVAYKGPLENGLSSTLFEVTTASNSSMVTVMATLTEKIEKKQEGDEPLLPTHIDAVHDSKEHRIVIGMTPAVVNDGDTALVFGLEGFAEKSVSDLEDTFNKWTKENSDFVIIDQAYYYGGNENLAMILYSREKES
jgi:hypothetical protein